MVKVRTQWDTSLLHVVLPRVAMRVEENLELVRKGAREGGGVA